MPTVGSTAFIENHKLRTTFAVAVAAVTLAVLHAGLVVEFARVYINYSSPYTSTCTIALEYKYPAQAC